MHLDIVPQIEYNIVRFRRKWVLRVRYLSTFEVAEKWGFLLVVWVFSVAKTASPAHSKQEAAGLFQKMQRSPLMPESKAANISKQKNKERGT